ncbi:hypothetical protein [Brucella sp. BZ]|uniref:hypothetical protein n=1 Tax=Brucella sp. BZ TaxID=3381346 RepID=UPI0039EB0094
MGRTKRMVRWLISRAANLTPNVTYYAKSWPVRINEKLVEMASQKGGKSTPMTVASISMCCALHSKLQVGDSAEIELHGVTTGGRDIGNFVVNVKRI